MTRDRWIPRSIVVGYLVMLSVLGGFTWLAFAMPPELVSDTHADAPPMVLQAHVEQQRLVVEAQDDAGHALTALSVRGVARPPGGGAPLPLRFDGHGDGRQQAAWPGTGGGWRAEITARSGARVATTVVVP